MVGFVSRCGVGAPGWTKGAEEVQVFEALKTQPPVDTTTMLSHTTRDRLQSPCSRFASVTRHAHSRAAQRGSTLSMALLLVMSAALVSVVTLQRGLQQWKSQATSSAEKLAFYMAEAGIADAIDDVRSGGSGNIGTQELPAVYGSGAFWVETVKDSHGVVHITSTGLYDGTSHRLSQALHKPELPIGDYGFFGSAGVNVGENVTIDSLAVEEEKPPVDESGGTSPVQRIALPSAPPVAQLSGLNLLGSDGTIELLGGTEVLGSVLAGPKARIENLYGAVVSGSTLPDDVSHTLPELSMPVTTSTAALTVASNTTRTLATGVHEYGAMKVNGRGKLTIVGPASVSVSSLIVMGGGVVVLDTTNGPVHFYVESHLGLRSSARITNSSGDASDAVFLVNARGAANHDSVADLEEPVEWQTALAFCGVVYAPYAAITLPAATVFQGAINALQLTIGDGSHLTFDPRVLDLDLRSRDYQFLSWRVLEIPGEEKTALRRDVVKEAAERGDTLLAPSAARIAATTEFRVRGDDGEEYTYKGTSLTDLTRVTVDAVLPVVVEVAKVPEFAEYTDDSTELRNTPEANFKEAYVTMLRYIGDRAWQDALETGVIPPRAVTAVEGNGILIEPFRSALKDTSVRADLDAYLAASWLPLTSKRFLDELIDLCP
jgi:hypothetical protein